MPEEAIRKPIPFDESFFSGINITLPALENLATRFSTFGSVTGLNRKAWAIKALKLTDLTTLAGDDTCSNVERLCIQAAYPLTVEQLTRLNLSKEFCDTIHTAAVCVYPSRVSDAHRILTKMNKTDVIQVAAVATGFPSGQYPLRTRLDEIRFAIENGATEIDIVVDRNLVLTNRWSELYDELVAMRLECGVNAHMKTILAIGECGTMENVYRAGMIACMAGTDFIKTSTGKESVNATIPVGLVMIRIIEEFYKKTNIKIGLKPAGGVKTVSDAIAWMTLIKNTLGDEWLESNLFRFGASSLLDDILKIILE